MAYVLEVLLLGFILSWPIYAQEEKNCEKGTADLVFIVDSSGSINKSASVSGKYENWQLSLRFLTVIVDKVDAGGAWRIGMVVYSQMAYNRFFLHTYTNKEDIKSAILNTGYLDSDTNTSGAIRTARTQQFLSSRGDRKDAANVVIILTDGMSTVDESRTVSEAMYLHNADVNVFSIGVTNNIDGEELAALSSPPQLQNENWFTAPDFDALSTIVDELTRKTCMRIFEDHPDDCDLELYKLFTIAFGILAAVFFIAWLGSSFMACALQYKLKNAESKLERRGF